MQRQLCNLRSGIGRWVCNVLFSKSIEFWKMRRYQIHSPNFNYYNKSIDCDSTCATCRTGEANGCLSCYPPKVLTSDNRCISKFFHFGSFNSKFLACESSCATCTPKGDVCLTCWMGTQYVNSAGKCSSNCLFKQSQKKTKKTQYIRLSIVTYAMSLFSWTIFRP